MRTEGGGVVTAADDLPGTSPDAGSVAVAVTTVLLGPEDLRGPVGRTPGREAVGTVTAVGAGVGDWHPGDRVALPATWTCGDCPACRAGRTTVCPDATVPGRDVDGWARPRVVVPSHLLHHVPGELDDVEGALVPGAAATAYQALKRVGVGPDVTVAVLGEDAVAALAVQLVALAGGTAVAIDPRAAGRELALDLGAEEALDPTAHEDLGVALAEAVGGRIDRVILTPTAGRAADEAVRLLSPGGRLVVVDTHGDPSATADGCVPVALLVAGDLDVVGTRGGTPQDVRELFDLAADGRLALRATVSAVHEVDDLDGALAALDDPSTLRVALTSRA